MERVEHIQTYVTGERRRNDTVDFFDGDADGRVRELVLGLVRADPAQRPSAADLLNGPLLPAPRELSTEVLDAATSALRNPLSPARATLLSALFDAPTSELVDVAYDQNERGAFSVAAFRDSRAREAARRRVVDQLEKAGAAPLDAPLLRPKPPPRALMMETRSSSTRTRPLPCRAVTRRPCAGVARSALSRRKARASFGTCKRYACAKVYAPSPPQERLEIAYDCVSRAAPEAVVCGEALALCVDACRAASGDADLAVEVRASHASLAPALAGLRQTAPPKIRDALDAQGGILRGGAVQALERLRSLLRRPVSDVAKRRVRESGEHRPDLFDAVTCAALAGIEDQDDALQHDEAEAALPISRVSSSPQSWDQRGGHMRHRSSIPDENDVDAVRKAARRCSRVEAATTILVDEALVTAAPYEGVFFEVRANDHVVAVGGCYGDVVARNVAPVERASLRTCRSSPPASSTWTPRGPRGRRGSQGGPQGEGPRRDEASPGVLVVDEDGNFAAFRPRGVASPRRCGR